MLASREKRPFPRVRVLFGPGMRLDRHGVSALCSDTVARLGFAAKATWCDVEAVLTAAIADARQAGEAILLCPGDLGDSEEVRRCTAASVGVPLVWVDLDAAVRPRDQGLAQRSIPTVRGRGLEGLSWALKQLAARASWTVTVERYGEGAEQVGDLRTPRGFCEPHPVCVVLHGGGWRERWERDLMEGLSVDLVRRGYATWNLEYRRVGPSGGGWPETCIDVAAGIDVLATLAEQHPLDTDRVAVIGHSAGGHLAAWSAVRSSLPEGAPGAMPAVRSALILPLAGIFDLAEAARRGLDEMSTIAFMGGTPRELPDAYGLASPYERLPLGVPQLIACGAADRPDLVDANRVYCARAKAVGDQVDYLELPGVDHFDIIDPSSLAWMTIVERFQRMFPPSRRTGPISEAPEVTAR